MKQLLHSVAFSLLLLAPGAVRGDSSSCYNIQDSDRRAFCLGTSERKISYCYNVRDMDTRHVCLGIASGQKSHCYNIQSKDLKNQCLASAGR